MGSINKFFKVNKKTKENVKYKATKSLCDDKGEVLEWTIRPLSTAENERIREDAMIEVPISGKFGQYRQKFLSSKYVAGMITASVVEPDLYNAELQDSYGVNTPEALLMAMVDDPGEYAAFTEFIEKFNGFDEILADKVEEAKN